MTKPVPKARVPRLSVVLFYSTKVVESGDTGTI